MDDAGGQISPEMGVCAQGSVVLKRCIALLNISRSDSCQISCWHRGHGVWFCEIKDEVPIIPGTCRKFAGLCLLNRAFELLVANLASKSLDVRVCSDVHYLRNESTAVSQRLLWRLPPDVFAGEGC